VLVLQPRRSLAEKMRFSLTRILGSVKMRTPQALRRDNRVALRQPQPSQTSTWRAKSPVRNHAGGALLPAIMARLFIATDMTERDLLEWAAPPRFNCWYARGCDHTIMNGTAPRFAGVELYFEDLESAREFYQAILGLQIVDEAPGRYAKLDGGPAFVCLERKGLEKYPSRDKAVLFFEIPNLEAVVSSIGSERIVHRSAGWAVLHDPEGHNILLIER
jgi:predicted enzyme related to lactoylglutathione lyase